jgi:CRP-like cAMP-binding protein
MTALNELYKAACANAGVKCNSQVYASLPNNAGVDFVEWNLSGNIVGTRGAAVIIAIVAESIPQLQTLNFSGNNLGSAVTKDMLEKLVNHPNISTIDLSKNDIRLGGPELVELLKRNRRITTLNIEDTHLRPLFVRLIEIQLRKNSGKAVAPPSSAADGGGAHGNRFSFGDENPEAGDTAFAAGESDAFAAFGAVQFQTNAGVKPAVPRRPTVCSEVYKEDEIDNFQPDVNEKDPKTKQFLMSVLERHDLFSHLEDFELSVAVDAMAEASRLKDEMIFEEGEENDLFFVVGNGTVELSFKGEATATLKKGNTAQDQMLLHPGNSRETAKCISDVVLYTLDRQTYRCVLSKASKKKRAMYEEFLNSVGFLKAASLTRNEILQLADSLKPAQFEAGGSLIRYGEVGETFYIIVEGVVEVFGRDDHQNVIKVCEFTKGDCVGELEFINNHKCVADVKAKDFVRVAKMNRRHFEMVMGPVKDVLARNAGESTVYEYYRHQLEKMDNAGH